MAALSRRVFEFPQQRPLASLVLAVLGCIVVGSAGSVFTTIGLDTWYRTLTRPPLAPPDWVFGPVWTTLFTLMGVAGWLIWRRTGVAEQPIAARARVALGVFVGHFVLNVGWSAAFFGLQSITAGLVVIVLLWGAILLTTILFVRVDWRAAALLVPYLLWVTFATYLNVGFWTLN